MKQIKIDVTDKYQQIIIQILHKFVANYEVWAFGSRVKWTAKPSSDLDLAIVDNENHKISYQEIYKLKDAFSESELPFSVDVVNFNKASTTFQEIIRQKYVVIYTPYQQEKIKFRFKADDGSDYPDWTNILLSDVGQIVGGGTPDTTNYQYWGDEIVWLTPTEINQKYINNSMRKITQLGLKCSTAKLLPINTILITTRASIGLIAIAKVPCTTNQGFQSLIVNNNHNQEFWYYQLSIMKNILNSYANGSTFLEISKNSLLQIVATAPSLPEQQKIANFLTCVDDLITSTKQQLELMKQYKQGIMQQIFSQKLRFKADDGSDYPDWEEKKLGEIFEGLKGSGLSKDDILEDGSYECILYGELYTKYKEVIKDVVSKTNKYEGTISKLNDLLIPASTTTNGSDLANVVALTCENILLGGDITILRNKQLADNIFYAYYLTHYKKSQLAQLAQGSTIVHLYYSHFKNLDIAYPSLPEQKKIANFLTAIDDSIKQQTAKLEQTELYKKALLQQMLNT